jgi:hypothetical protein
MLLEGRRIVQLTLLLHQQTIANLLTVEELY